MKVIKVSEGTFRVRDNFVEFRSRPENRYRPFANTGKAALIEEAHRLDHRIARLRAEIAALASDRDALWEAGTAPHTAPYWRAE